jgi:hypothetical protein
MQMSVFYNFTNQKKAMFAPQTKLYIMKKNTFILSFSIAAILISCKKEKEPEPGTGPEVETFEQMQKAEWLIGEWGAAFPDGSVLTESWTKDNDSVFSAKTYVVAGKDTVFSEMVSLQELNGKLIYNVSVSDQNEGKAVAFEMTSATEKQLVFENPTHDYPKKITYNKFENDSLVAEISGMEKGKPKTESFPMKKLK